MMKKDILNPSKTILEGGGENWHSPEISTLNINAEANFMTSGLHSNDNPEMDFEDGFEDW